MSPSLVSHMCRKAYVLVFGLTLLLFLCVALTPSLTHSPHAAHKRSSSSNGHERITYTHYRDNHTTHSHRHNKDHMYDSRHHYCPASCGFDLLKDHLFKYPVDIYDPHYSDSGSGSGSGSDVANGLFNCSARRVGVYSQHKCRADVIDTGTYGDKVHAMCPVAHDHLHLIVNSTSWKVQNSRNFIHLLDRMFSPKLSPVTSKEPPVRIIILGGSVTAGHETEGYCCSNTHLTPAQSHLVDKRCNIANDCINYFKNILPHLHHDNSVSWVKYLSRALAHNSNIPLEVYSLAAPGTTSNYMASHISGYLNKLPPIRNNTNDVIFIDYSYNDGRVFQGPKRSMLDQAIESLVRNILTAYPLAPDVRPHIILLESYVHSHGVFGRKCGGYERGGGNIKGGVAAACTSNEKKMNPITEQSNDYSVAYRRIARHYGLQIWSTRNIYWNYYRQDQWSPSFLNYMIQGHPPWHVHLYWADAYLSVMKYALRDHLAALDSAKQLDEDRNARDILIDPLVKAEDMSSQQCDWTSPLLADLSFDFSGNINHFSSYTAVPPNSWIFVKDGGDKPGWITQPGFRAHSLVVPLNTSNLLKWSTGLSKQERLDRLDNRDIVLIFSYLKSYEKMLTVSLELCNHTVATENALWPDRFSLSYTSVLPIGHFIENHCGEAIAELVANSASNPSLLQPSLDLTIHSPAPNAPAADEDLSGKFKLLGMTVCETSTGGAPFFSAQTLIP